MIFFNEIGSDENLPMNRPSLFHVANCNDHRSLPDNMLDQLAASFDISNPNHSIANSQLMLKKMSMTKNKTNHHPTIPIQIYSKDYDQAHNNRTRYITNLSFITTGFNQ